MSGTDIVIVGAGPAGLAVSACLRRAGLAHLLLERESVAAPAWQRHYDRLHLHSDKRYSALPHAPWPAEAPRYPSRAEVVDYLADYAARHAAPARLGVEVRRIARHGERFRLDTRAGSLAARFVVVATGSNCVPHRPAWRGLARFEGPVLHSSDYRNPAPFHGLRTLVVGCGNSGAEIALDLAQAGVDTALVVRGPVHVVPRDLLGRPTQETAVLLSRLPIAWRDALVTPALNLVVGDLSRWGIVRPATGPNRMIDEAGRVPMLDIGTVALIKAGRIRVLPGVEEVDAGRVRFADGHWRPFDAIVLATGYRSGLGALVEGFDAVADARGRPDRFGRESAIPGLWFVGFRNPPTGALREMAIEAERVADELAGRLGAARPAA